MTGWPGKRAGKGKPQGQSIPDGMEHNEKSQGESNISSSCYFLHKDIRPRLDQRGSRILAFSLFR